MRFPSLLLAFLLTAGCASEPAQEPYTAGEVDLARYQGTWYELARLPMFFQRNCVESEAHYRLQGDERVAVTNRCRTEDGQWQEATGTAVPQEPGRSDRLWVRFDNWFSRLFPTLTRGHYWVLYLDPDYRVALVAARTASTSGCFRARPRFPPRRESVCWMKPMRVVTTPAS